MAGCNCHSGTHIQGYENTIQLIAPDWSEKEYIVVDKCIAPEIQSLWDHGIRTCGSCCGHHIGDPYIQACDLIDAISMAEIGYLVAVRSNGIFVARPKTIESYNWMP